jgi:hypothetical protein
MRPVILDWDGDDGGELRDPTADDLDRTLGRLDGRRCTLLTLQSEAGHLTIGGSAGDGLVVYAEVGDGAFWTARAPGSASNGTVRVVAGGQPGDYPVRLVTTREVARAAATAFLTSGTLSKQVEWERS